MTSTWAGCAQLSAIPKEAAVEMANAVAEIRQRRDSDHRAKVRVVRIGARRFSHAIRTGYP